VVRLITPILYDPNDLRLSATRLFRFGCMSILNGINLMENSKIPGRSFAELIGFFEVCARLLEALHLKAARGNVSSFFHSRVDALNLNHNETSAWSSYLL